MSKNLSKIVKEGFQKGLDFFGLLPNVAEGVYPPKKMYRIAPGSVEPAMNPRSMFLKAEKLYDMHYVNREERLAEAAFYFPKSPRHTDPSLDWRNAYTYRKDMATTMTMSDVDTFYWEEMTVREMAKVPHRKAPLPVFTKPKNFILHSGSSEDSLTVSPQL